MSKWWAKGLPVEQFWGDVPEVGLHPDLLATSAISGSMRQPLVKKVGSVAESCTPVSGGV